MHVLATAGHVDHGKSTLVRALTGMEPDRYAEEKRRGLTIDLGFAWADIDGEQIAIVDVPGHERFVPTMLAGVGPVPAVLFVVAADGGWMPQSQEHLDALDALRVRHGLLVVTRSDLADPRWATEQAREQLQGTTLEGIECVAVSAVGDPGMPTLRAALTRLVRTLPQPDRNAPIRLWVDRAFSIKGAGTVVTGTLAAGTLRTGDKLELPGAGTAHVRGLQSLGRSAATVDAVARVAVNLRGAELAQLPRGTALITPGTHRSTALADVRWHRAGADLPTSALLHIGAAQVTARIRPLGDRAARLQLEAALPLRIGDVGLLRDPGRRQVLSGFTVLDVDPPALRRRGAALARAAQLEDLTGRPDAGSELARRLVVRRADLVAMGVSAADAAALPGADAEWAIHPEHAEQLRADLARLLARHRREHPLENGVPVEMARHALKLPAARLVYGLATAPLSVAEGRVVDPAQHAEALPDAVARALDAVRSDLAKAPYAAPEAHRLRDLGLGPRELAAAVRVGALAKVGEGVYLTPEALRGALGPLRQLPQPFTSSQARQAWATSRRVALPLLDRLDRLGVTKRLPDDTRILTSRRPG
jgi:selenocysteine-specific elongation factor